jgi:hypothetical protein
VAAADAPSPAAASARTSDADPSTLRQLEALSAIRTILASRAPLRALAMLDAFDRAYPSTPLKEEVTVLRIDTLSDLGRTSEAAALAAEFLRANPDSAYTRRVRSKLKVP